MKTSSKNNTEWNEFYLSLKDKKLPASETLMIALKHFYQSSPGFSTKQAIDLGCGNGIDTYELLKQGWHVVAIDHNPKAILLLEKSLSLNFKNQLKTETIAFENVVLFNADFINASFALPFCHPENFSLLWKKIEDALNNEGYFAGHFFGHEDTWAGDTSMTFHSEYEIKCLLKDFDILYFKEIKKPGQTLMGEIKFWHVFHIAAKKLKKFNASVLHL